jgi:hypothetical protein
MTAIVTVLAEIGWNPEIRNILSVLVGFGVLIGSVYLLVGSNTGLRTGLLITLACLLGWMTTMGGIWWLYGIGLQGRAAAWHVQEINYSDSDYSGLEDAQLQTARDLAQLADVPSAQELIEQDPTLIDEILPEGLDPEVREARAQLINLGQIIEARPELGEELDFEATLNGWDLLGQSNRIRGDAVASADAFVGPDQRGLFESSSGYQVRDVFVIGGRPEPDSPSVIDGFVHKVQQTLNPIPDTEYAVVQLQAVLPECEEGVEPDPDTCFEIDPNAGAPTPQLLEDAPIISVVMVRDLGILRVPAILLTFICGGLFALTVWTLHRRDKVISAVRGA